MLNINLIFFWQVIAVISFDETTLQLLPIVRVVQLMQKIMTNKIIENYTLGADNDDFVTMHCIFGMSQQLTCFRNNEL